MWRDSGKAVKFFGIDGRLVFFLVIFIFHFSYFTLGLFLSAVVFFGILERMGYTLPNALRRSNVLISGNRKAGVHWWRRNRLWY